MIRTLSRCAPGHNCFPDPGRGAVVPRVGAGKLQPDFPTLRNSPVTIRTATFAVGCFALGLLPMVFAADPPSQPNPIGVPKKGDPGGGVGVFRVWYADGTWHLRTSTENSVGKKD